MKTWEYRPEKKIRFNSFTGERYDELEHWVFEEITPVCLLLRIESADKISERASLISSAPEMLAELEFLIEYCVEKDVREYADGTKYEVEFLRDYGGAVERIRNLIAKARGKS